MELENAKKASALISQREALLRMRERVGGSISLYLPCDPSNLEEEDGNLGMLI